MDELRSNPSPYSFPKREDQLAPLGLQRPLPLRTIEATAIDVEPLLHSELLSDGLVDCHYLMPLASRRARPSHVFCLYAFQSLTVRRFQGARKMGSDPSSDRLPYRLAVINASISIAYEVQKRGARLVTIQ